MYENRPDERSEQILICIEKQALVQTIIKEFAKHLVPEKYIFVTSVSGHSSRFYTACVIHLMGVGIDVNRRFSEVIVTVTVYHYVEQSNSTVYVFGKHCTHFSINRNWQTYRKP